MRMRGDGPPYSKVGSKLVLYNVGDLLDWLSSRIRTSTSEEISSSIKNPDVLQALLVERICLRAIQSKRLNYVAREYWTSLFVPEIIEPVMPEISLIHYVKQKAYDPKVNFKSMSKIANEIHVLEAGIENQIIKMMKALN